MYVFGWGGTKTEIVSFPSEKKANKLTTFPTGGGNQGNSKTKKIIIHKSNFCNKGVGVGVYAIQGNSKLKPTGDYKHAHGNKPTPQHTLVHRDNLTGAIAAGHYESY